MFRTVQKLLNKEEAEEIKLPQKMRKRISHEVQLCEGCGHLYFYRIVRCPLCESHDIRIVRKEIVKKDLKAGEDTRTIVEG